MTRVLVAGSGVAAAEALLALRALAGDRLELELLSPSAELDERAWSVLTPFGAEPAPRVDLTRLVADLDIHRHEDALERVEAGRHAVITRRGASLPYDVLLVATGAHSRVAVPGAVTFRGPLSTGAVEGVLAHAVREPALRLVFTAPGGATWPLPLYELALMSAAYLREHGVGAPDITVATPEAAPLAALGATPSAAVTEELDRYGIRVVTHAVPEAAVDGTLSLRGGRSVEGDEVVALGEVVGPRIPGLQHDGDGFLPVDLHGRVHGCEDVFAAGDVTNVHIKHGGLATQQADAAAEAIADPASATPFHPVVRAMLLAGDEPLYIAADLTRRDGVVSREPLWQPVDKISGRYLSPYLAAVTPPRAR
jgi:sulfide:quinone oxidoreductase